MFKEILQIIPKLSGSDLSNMERSLQSRFTKIAKGFGKGLIATLTGGGIAGLALGLVDKLLNPLKETQDAIDRALKNGEELVTNAKQFDTTAGKLFRLQQFARSKGIDAGELELLLSKFQGAVAEAAADPNKQTSVRNFVGQKDTAEAFFEFIQGIQKLNKTQQILAEKDVFGERERLRVEKLVGTDFAEQAKLIGGPKSEKLTTSLEKLNALEDLKAALEARRTLEDTVKKSGIITEGMVRSQDTQAKLDLEKENKQIKSYDDLAAISIASTQVLNLVKDAALGLTSMLVKVTDLAENVKKLTNSRVVKGILKVVGGQ